MIVMAFDFFQMQKICPCEIYIKQNSVLNNLQAPWFSHTTDPYDSNKQIRQNNKAHRKVQLAPVMTLYSQVQQDISCPRLFYRPVSFTASTLEVDGGGGCRYGGVANKEGSYCSVVGEFVCTPKSIGLTGFDCCSSTLYPLENEFCQNSKSKADFSIISKGKVTY